MIRKRFASVMLASLLVAPPAVAQDGDGDDEERPVEIREGAEGEYGGVRPGQAARVPHKRPKAGTLAWVGFTPDGGAAQIFLQAPNEFSYSQRVEGKTLIVHLEGLKYLGRQVRRPLYTQHFDTPVDKISVKKVSARKARKGRPGRKAGIEVHIQLDGPAREAAARAAMEADGYFYLYLEIPPGSNASP